MTAAVILLAGWAAALAVLAVVRPAWLLPAAIACAPFEGAAVVNAGGVGVSPYFFTLVLIAARCPLVRTTRPTLLGRTPEVRRVMAWVAGLVAIGVAGAVVLPRVFAGYPVISPRLDAEAAAPLSFSTGNVAQSIYLGLNAALLWYAAQTGGDAATVRRVVVTLRWTGGVVVAIAVYQFAAAVTGLPYPDEFLYSNPTYVMQVGTTIGDLPRLCSTFTEPAGMAVFLVGYLVVLIAEPPPTNPTGWRTATRAGLVVATVAVAAVSTSSTALLGLAGVGAWAAARYVAWPAVTGRPSWRATAALGAVATVAGYAYVTTPALQQLVTDMVLNKDQSASYDERHGADTASTQLAVDTWGLGVGLGSNRASSFGPSMLSTIGVYGAAALAGAAVELVRPLRRRRDDVAGRWYPPLAAGLAAVLVAKLVSSPDLATPTMWMFMAALVCVRGAAEAVEADPQSTEVVA